MEPIKKHKLHKTVLRVPTDAKAALRSGMSTYDMMGVMCNTINEQAANTNAAIDYVDKTVEAVEANEQERMEAEAKREKAEDLRAEEFEQIKREAVGATAFAYRDKLADLPLTPTEEEKKMAFIVDGTVYMYVAKGGDVLDGKYKYVGDFKGQKGDTGEQGPRGVKGDKGETGERGEKGETGERGEKGDKGETGERGEKGETGEQGPVGPAADTTEIETLAAAAAESAQEASKSAAAIQTAVEEANTSATEARSAAESAAASASSAETKASEAAASLAASTTALEQIAGSGEIPEATVAQVALNTAGINDLALKMGKETNNVELVLDNNAYYVSDNNLRIGYISGYKSSNFTSSSGVGEPVKMKAGDTLYVKVQSQSYVGNNTVFITSTGGASIGKQVKSILTSEQTKNGFTFVATEDCDVFINNYTELEPSPIIHLTTYNIPFVNKEYVDNELLKKQNELKSGINIKTVNGESILGNGDIEIKLDDGHWEDTDYTDKLAQRGVYYINYNGNLHVNTNDNYFNSPAKNPQFGNDVIVVHPGEKIYIKAAIKAVDSFPTSVIFTSVTENFVLNTKPVLKSFGATEAIEGIEWTSDGNYEVYVNNDLSVCADPIIKISKWITKDNYATTDYVDGAKQEAVNEANNYTNDQLSAFAGGFNPFKGKKMCIIGASNTGGLNDNPNYPSYAKRTCELLNMTLIDKAQQPRFYSCGGKCYKLQAEDGTVVYTDFSPLEIANAKDKYYHFQTERGSWDSNGWSFVGVSDNVVTLKKNGTNKTFTYTSSTPLEGMFHIGIASTVAEINATNPAMVKQSYEKFLLDDSIDVLLLGLQAIEVSAWGGENTEVVSLMRRPTRTASAGDECHFTYADGVPLEDRRYCDSGALIYLIDRVLNANPKCRIILAQDKWGLDDEAKSEYGIMGLQMIVDRFKSMDMMALKFGFQVVNHWSKTGFSYINETEYFNSDRAHLNDKGMKLVGEIFAGELLAGTQDAVMGVVMNMLP